MKKLSIIILLTGMVINEINAQLLKVDQAVYGMDCAPCAYGLERGFKKMTGIESVKVSLNDGKAYLTLAPENDLTLKKIQETVKSNGFSSRSAEVVLLGELSEIGSDMFININNEIFRVEVASGDNLNTELKPGKVKVRGVVADKQDNLVDNKWEIRVAEIL